MRRSDTGSIQPATSLESGSRVEAFIALRRPIQDGCLVIRHGDEGRIGDARQLGDGAINRPFRRGCALPEPDGPGIGFGDGWCSAGDGDDEQGKGAGRHGPQRNAVICSVFKMSLTPKD